MYSKDKELSYLWNLILCWVAKMLTEVLSLTPHQSNIVSNNHYYIDMLLANNIVLNLYILFHHIDRTEQCTVLKKQSKMNVPFTFKSNSFYLRSVDRTKRSVEREELCSFQMVSTRNTFQMNSFLLKWHLKKKILSQILRCLSFFVSFLLVFRKA